MVYLYYQFTFKQRNNDKNIYIAHNGYIRKLSLNILFLPFITLQIGEYINIEAFLYHDAGTIIKYCKQKNENNMIYYKIRSQQNVYYNLNYYQIQIVHHQKNIYHQLDLH